MSYKLRKPRSGKSDYWQALITTPDGRRIERSTRCKRKSEARVVAEGWDREAATARHQVTLAQALEAWRTHKADDKKASESTLEILELKAGHLLAHFGAERNVDTLRLADTVGYLRARRTAGVSDSTVEHELRELRGALRLLRRHDLYDRDPAALWPGAEMRAPKKRKRWLPIAEYEKVRLAIGGTTGYFRAQPAGEGVKGRRGPGEGRRKQWIEHDQALGQDWRDHLAVYCYVGLRLAELYRLWPRHLDGDHLDVPGTKTEGAARRVPLHPVALEVLQRRAALAGNGPLFPVTSPDWGSQKRAWLRALKKACERAQVPHASTNDLRRTFCSWAWQAGVAEALVVRWMGHHSVRMVREVYAQTSDEHGRDAIASLPHISHNHGAIPRTPARSGATKTL